MDSTAQLRRASWLDATPAVTLVCEIAADYVCAVRHRRGRVEAWATRPLPDGAVRPAPLADNVADRAAVQQALEHVLGAVGNGERRCALLVPDLVARVTVLEFDNLPAHAEDAEALLRWRLGKDLPFDVTQAALSFQVQPARAAGQEALVAAALRNLVRQYEECLEALGLQPGWVTLSTLAALGGLDAAAPPRLVVKSDHSSLAIAAVHGRSVRLFRSLPLAAGATDAEGLFDNIYPAAVYFQDHWGEPVSEAVLVGVSAARSGLGQRLESELNCRVRELDLAAHELPPSPLTAAAPDHRLAACVGWVRGEAE